MLRRFVPLLLGLICAMATAPAEADVGNVNSPLIHGPPVDHLLVTEDELTAGGLVDYNAGRWSAAISNLTAAVRVGATNSVVYSTRGISFLMTSNWDAAIKDLGRAIELNPEDVTPYLYRGCARRAKGQLSKALADFDRYLEAVPTNEFAYKSRASVYNGLGDFIKAIKDWNQGLRERPQDATALAMRGYAFYMTQQYDRALDDYQEALRLEPTNAAALNNLAWLRATCPIQSMRNGREAVKAARKACEQSQWTRWDWVDTLAAALAEAGDFADAVKYEAQAMTMKGVGEKERAAMQQRLLLYRKSQPYRL